MADLSQKMTAHGDEAAIKVAFGPQSRPQSPHKWLLALILVVAVVLAYQPVWHAGFIWDDDDHVTANPCIIGPLGLKEIWTTSAARYYPLVLTSFWVEHALWGLNPLFYHLVNVLGQTASAVVLWRLLLCLRIPGAWLGAALWALHPVQVETVAWISELKNTQSGLFYLLSILFFVKDLRARQSGHSPEASWNYALTLLFAALAMTSKSSTVVLPVVLCLCAWWVEARWHWRNVAKVAPVFLMSLAAAVLAMGSVELYGDPHNTQWSLSWPQRLITSGYVVWFYLGKLLWPHPLIFIYPRWNIDATRGIEYLPLLAVILLMGVLWGKRETWGRPSFFALAYFLVALLPVLDLVNHFFLRYSFVADHLQYLATMGPVALAGAGLTKLADLVLPGKTGMQRSVGAALLLVLGSLSWERAWVYGNEKMLWTDTLPQNPDSWMVHNNLGMIYLENGQADEARAQFQRTLELNPTFANAHYNLGNALLQKGQADGAISEYQKTLEVLPGFAYAHFNLGLALAQKGRVDDAMAQFKKTVEIDPNHAKAHYHLGESLLQKGQLDGAIAEFQRDLQINPNDAYACYDLGNTLLQRGQIDNAIHEFQEAVRLKSDFTDAQTGLARAQAMLKKAPDPH